MTTTRSIDTTELRDRLGDPSLTIVDVRPLAAYNGWRLDGEDRGGHIPGAVAFPCAWLDTRRRARDRPICSTRRASPRGRDGRRLRRSSAGCAAPGRARSWRSASTTSASTTAGFPALGGRRRRCRSSACRSTSSSSTSTGCARCSTARRPRPRPTGDFLLFHVNFGVPEEYAEAHIPGALYLDTNWLEDPADWNRRSPEELDGALRALGITTDTTVVVYGRDTEGDANEKWPGRRAGQIAATRALMILTLRRRRRRAPARRRLRLVGPRRQSGRDRHPRAVAGRPTSGSPIPLRPEVIVDIDEAKEIIADHGRARRWSASGRGASTSAPSAATTTSARRAGSTATCGATAARTRTTCSTTATSTTRCAPTRRSPPTGPRPGITPDKWVAFYCGTGWRASETWFYAFLQDWPRIAVYDGGWFEWSQDPINNPIEIGEPGDGEPRDVYVVSPTGGRARCHVGARRSRAGIPPSAARCGHGGRRAPSPPDRRARDAAAPLRLAIVGCGDVAYRHYLPALEPAAARVRIVSFVDPRPGAAERAAASVAGWSPDARASDTLDAMLGPAVLDAAIDLARRPSTAGQPGDPRRRLHLYSEKPLAGTVAEADRLIATARPARRHVPVRAGRGRDDASDGGSTSSSVSGATAGPTLAVDPSRGSRARGVARVHRRSSTVLPRGRRSGLRPRRVPAARS